MYYFAINNKKTIHRDLAVYHAGEHLFETAMPWTFYITTPKASACILETSIKSDCIKGISCLLISPPAVGVGAFCNPLEFINFLHHIDETAEKTQNLTQI